MLSKLKIISYSTKETGYFQPRKGEIAKRLIIAIKYWKKHVLKTMGTHIVNTTFFEPLF